MNGGKDWANPEAEQAALATVLTEERAYDSVADVFDPALFTIAANRAIATAIVDLARARKPLDPVVLLTDLEQRGWVPNPVPRELPFVLARAAGTAAGLRYYLESLRSLWAHRRARQIAREILEDDREIPGEELMAEISRKVSAVEVRKLKPFRTMGDAIFDRVGVYEKARLNPEAAAPLLWSTGLTALDRLIGGIQAARLVVVGARPNVGKTAFMLVLADNLAAAGVPSAIFELEDEESVLAERVISRRAQIVSGLLRGNGSSLRPEHWERIGSPAFLGSVEWPLYVDDEHGLYPEDLAARMRRFTREKGVRVFFVDHLRELRLRERRDGRHDLAVGDALRLLRDTAKELEAGLVVMSQLVRDIERRADPTPRLSDLRDSGDIEAEARVVIFLDKQGSNFTLDVAKNTGPKGKVVLNWLEDYNAIQEWRVA